MVKAGLSELAHIEPKSPKWLRSRAEKRNSARLGWNSPGVSGRVVAK